MHWSIQHFRIRIRFKKHIYVLMHSMELDHLSTKRVRVGMMHEFYNQDQALYCG